MSAPETEQPVSGARAAETAPDAWKSVRWLPCRLSVELPAARITLQELLALGPGSVLASAWSDGSDLPVAVNGQRVGWAEFEVVGDRLAVRITELV